MNADAWEWNARNASLRIWKHGGRLWREVPSPRGKKTEPTRIFVRAGSGCCTIFGCAKAQITATPPQIRPGSAHPGSLAHIILSSEEFDTQFAGRSSDSASTPRAVFSALANDILRAAPLHSSGPVGDSHSVPFSPVQSVRTPVNSHVFCFCLIVAPAVA